MMNRLPAELIAEIAEWCLLHGKSEVASLSCTNHRNRVNSIPLLCRSITLRDGLGMAKSQVKALAMSGMIHHTQCLTIGVGSFIPKGSIDAMTREAGYLASASLCPHERNESYETLIRSEIDWKSHTPHSIDVALLVRLLSACSARLCSLRIRNITSLGTSFVDEDGYARGCGSTTVRYARDYILLSLQPFESIFFQGLSEAAIKVGHFPMLRELDFHIYTYDNFNRLFISVGKAKKAAARIQPLVKNAERISINAIHSSAIGEYERDIHSFDKIMRDMEQFLVPLSRGKLRKLELALTKKAGMPKFGPAAFPTFYGLTRLSLDDMYLFENNLERTIRASPHLTSLRFEYVDYHLEYTDLRNPEDQDGVGSTVKIVDGSDRSRALWAKLLNCCAELSNLIEVEMDACGYHGGEHELYNYNVEKACKRAKKFGVSANMLCSSKKADYRALRDLFTRVTYRRRDRKLPDLEELGVALED